MGVVDKSTYAFGCPKSRVREEGPVLEYGSGYGASWGSPPNLSQSSAPQKNRRTVKSDIRVGRRCSIMRFILCFLLALVAAPAWADWVRIDENAYTIYYIDPLSIRKNGNYRKVWGVQDLKRRDRQDGEMSRRVLWEHDCKDERSRVLAFSLHPEPMVSGKALFSDSTASTWSAVPPNTVAQTVQQTVCAR